MAPSTLDQEELLKSGLFDPQWYLDRNTDVQILGMDPLEHFLWLGSRLNRSPGPKFDSERYLQVNVDVARTDYNPVLHYIRYGKKEGRQAFEVSETSGDLHRRHDSGPRRTTGDVPYRPGRPTVLLCSHVAGETLFGGERSLLDMLGGLDALDFNVIVTVPGTGNAAYFDQITVTSRYSSDHTDTYSYIRLLEAGRMGDLVQHLLRADLQEVALLEIPVLQDVLRLAALGLGDMTLDEVLQLGFALCICNTFRLIFKKSTNRIIRLPVNCVQDSTRFLSWPDYI